MISQEIFYEEVKEVFSNCRDIEFKDQVHEVRQKIISRLISRQTHNVTSENLCSFPSTPKYDPEFPRPSNKISSTKQNSHLIETMETSKAKIWVVKENKEKPWNMEKVLEELGEVLNDKCIVI